MLIDKNNPDLAVGHLINGFRIKQIDALPKLNNIMYQLEHETTGALLIHLSNDDDNNCFSVAFRTTPTDSTGVAHILEHTALCGSRNFPVRDPFFSMIRRSMKTFMNAFTASDWTMYPFSSQNVTDYYNLMSIYLDAAFFPLLSETSFAQEGHRLEFAEMEKPESPLTIQGIVYSEMQGAMSSPSHIMHQCTGRSLFPTVTYKYNSGGEPEDILHLSHQQLLDFHQFHYHPSNSLFYTYGDKPLKNHLKFINDKALSQFQKIQVNTAVQNEQRYTEPKSFEYYYPLNANDDDGEKCQVALAWLTCNIQEPIEVLSLQLINIILLGHSGAPLRKRLLESKLGKSLADTTGFEDEVKEPYVSFGLQGVAEKDIDKVEDLILRSLQEIVDEGINQDQIESAIHQIEFDTREISGGHYPYSLNLLFRFFGTWVHGGDPVTAIDFDTTLSQLEEKISAGPFLEQQITKYLIDNPHRAKIVLKPDPNLEKRRVDNLKQRLDELKQNLSEPEKQKIIHDAIALKKYQEQKEDLSCLPSLSISDIPESIKFVDAFQEGFNDLDITFYDRPTNGIAYFNWYFKLNGIPLEERKWLPLLGYLLTNTGAGALSYEALSEQISRYTGGFSASPIIESNIQSPDSNNEFFSISSKALYRNQERMFALATKIMGNREFDEFDRIQSLIGQRTNNMFNMLVQAGHNYAASLSSRNFSKASQIDELYSGVHQVKFMKQIAKIPPDELRMAIEHLRRLFKTLLRKENLSMLVIGEKHIFEDTEKLILAFMEGFVNSSSEISIFNELPSSLSGDFVNGQQREAWLTTTPVSYIAQSYKTITYSHEDSPYLLVLANLLKSCFLHGEIREKGGAYGAMAGFNTDEGIFSLLSYRDPHLARTTDIFAQSLMWLKQGNFSTRDVEETILQTCSNMDTPVSPAGKAAGEYINKRKGKTKADREKFREGVLRCQKKDLIRVCEQHLDSQPNIAAITSDEIVKRDNHALLSNPLATFLI